MRTYTVNEYDQEDYSRVKEEMTDHEAARILEKIERGFLPGYDFTGEPRDFENYRLHVAVCKAIKALI